MAQQGFSLWTPVVKQCSSEWSKRPACLARDTGQDRTKNKPICGCKFRKSKNIVPILLILHAITIGLFLISAICFYRSTEGNKRKIDELSELVYKHCIPKETDQIRVSAVNQYKSEQTSDLLQRIIRSAGKEKTDEQKKTTKRRHNRKRKGKKSCCKRGKRGKPGVRGERGPQGDRGLQGERGPQGAPGENSSPVTPTIRAAHYTADLWRDVAEEEFGEGMDTEGVKCKYFKKWGGKACRNRTLEIHKTNFKFMKEADWVKNNKHIYSPADYYNNGSYVIRESGLYLIYTSILFYDAKMKQSQTILRNGEKLFKCMDGVDFIWDGKSRTYNSKYKTCSITGVAFLHKNDVIVIQNLYNNTVIDISPDSTFFGLVQLVPGQDNVTPNT